jgi:hypothetical protein
MSTKKKVYILDLLSIGETVVLTRVGNSGNSLLLASYVTAMTSRKHQCSLYIQLVNYWYRMAAASVESTLDKKRQPMHKAPSPLKWIYLRFVNPSTTAYVV